MPWSFSRRLEEDFDFVADLEVFDVVEFGAGDDALGFVADVHQDFLGADFEDVTFDYFARGEARGGALQGFFHREHKILYCELREACSSPWGR